MTSPKTYKEAGVDIDAGSEATDRIKRWVKRTSTPQVLSEIGLFGGLFDVSALPEKQPVLVSSVDSVGTKTKVAVACNRFDTLGVDIVNHCANDILVQGARPLFFLDYIALGKLDPEQIEQLVKGVSDGCVANGCALVGGEMCEMPDVYAGGDIDLVGSIVGVVDKPKILDGSKVAAGDHLIGIASSGLHTNGYTLARKVLYNDDPARISDRPEGWSKTLGEALLAPHRSYVGVILPLLQKGLIHGMAHITGGGIPGNLSRTIPDGLEARVNLGSWPIPPLFQLLAEKTGADNDELYRTFNMGVGMVVCVPAESADEVLESLNTPEAPAWRIGEVVRAESDVPRVRLVAQ